MQNRLNRVTSQNRPSTSAAQQQAIDAAAAQRAASASASAAASGGADASSILADLSEPAGPTSDGSVVRWDDERAERHLERLRRIVRESAMQARREDQARTLSGQMPGQGRRPRTDWVVRIDRTNHPVRVTATDGGADVVVDGRTIAVRSVWAPGDTLWTGTIAGETVAVQVDPAGIGCRLIHGGTVIESAVLEPRAATLADLMPVKVPPDLSRFLLSPMPGLLVSVAVKPGDEVKAGQELAVVEAMKMENILRAERKAVVRKLNAAAGASLKVDDIIMEFE
jgi:propionyl-CoA carboxylase alpha chain